MKAFLLLFLISISLAAQELKPVESIPLTADQFHGVDAYKNLYYTRDMVLYKKGVSGDFRFSDFQLGTVSYVDLINPLKVSVFFSDTNTLVFLDNRLNEIERINFNAQVPFLNVSMATNAGNNRLWIFNTDTQQVELYNYRTGRKIAISQPIIEKVQMIRSNFNYCYLLTSEGIQLYNVYGSLLSESDHQDTDRILLLNESVYGLIGNELIPLGNPDPTTKKKFDKLKLPVPENTIKHLQLTQDFLYLYDGKRIHTFSLNQPKQ